MTTRSPVGDLSSVFGTAAAASVRRRFRAHRNGEAREDPVPDADERAGADAAAQPETVEEPVPDPRNSRALAAAHGPAAAAARGRPRAVKVRDRGHVDLLLLAAVAAGPVNGRELVEVVRERSGGRFTLPLRVVVHQLRRLTRNRLMQVTDEAGRRYVLTPLGERVLASRRREWEAFSRGIDAVLDAADR